MSQPDKSALRLSCLTSSGPTLGSARTSRVRRAQLFSPRHGQPIDALSTMVAILLVLLVGIPTLPIVVGPMFSWSLSFTHRASPAARRPPSGTDAVER